MKRFKQEPIMPPNALASTQECSSWEAIIALVQLILAYHRQGLHD